MRKTLLILAIAGLLISGCALRKIVHPVESQTGTGEAVVVVEPTPTGNRSDVPAGWKEKDTVTIKQEGKAETYVNKKTGQVAQNKAAQAITKAIETPKKSRAWLWWTGGILIALALVDRLLKSFVGVNPFGWLLGKVFKKKKGD